MVSKTALVVQPGESPRDEDLLRPEEFNSIMMRNDLSDPVLYPERFFFFLMIYDHSRSFFSGCPGPSLGIVVLMADDEGGWWDRRRRWAACAVYVCVCPPGMFPS